MKAKVRALLMAGCTVGGLSVMGCGKEEVEDFGFTCIDLNPGESVKVDPFLGTYKIIVRLNYEACLKDYYLNKHPEMRLDGKEGPAVFEELLAEAWRRGNNRAVRLLGVGVRFADPGESAQLEFFADGGVRGES